jgi:hypothetical protein
MTRLKHRRCEVCGEYFETRCNHRRCRQCTFTGKHSDEEMRVDYDALEGIGEAQSYEEA